MKLIKNVTGILTLAAVMGFGAMMISCAQDDSEEETVITQTGDTVKGQEKTTEEKDGEPEPVYQGVFVKGVRYYELNSYGSFSRTRDAGPLEGKEYYTFRKASESDFDVSVSFNTKLRYFQAVEDHYYWQSNLKYSADVTWYVQDDSDGNICVEMSDSGEREHWEEDFYGKFIKIDSYTYENYKVIDSNKFYGVKEGYNYKIRLAADDDYRVSTTLKSDNIYVYNNYVKTAFIDGSLYTDWKIAEKASF